MADDGTDDTSSTTKYHQVAVPDHPLSSPTTGNTFTRMGSFPATADPAPPPASFQKSLAMASLTSASRVATGGHWSHSDGNRVTTTVGNVVDVIQGSYVGYRTAAASPPGPTLSCTWASTSYTQVGSEDTPVGWSGGSWTTPPTDPSGSSASTDNVAYATVTSALQSGTQVGSASTSSTDTTVDSNLPAAGDVVSATWAARVLTYVGSQTKPVPYVYAATYAGSSTSSTVTTGNNTTTTQATGGNVASNTTVTGGNNTSSTTVTGGGVTSTTTVSGGDSSSTVSVTGGTVISTTTADAITTLQMAKGAITSVNLAPENFSFQIGATEMIYVGATSTIMAGLVANINIGPTANFNIGASLNFTSPESVEMHTAKELLEATKTKLHGVATTLSNVKTSLSSAMSSLSESMTSLYESDTALGGEMTRLYGVAMMGF